MAKNNKTDAQCKPKKPYPDFPLFPHATGRWAKKIRGKMCYFGPWADVDAALATYERQREDLYAGRKPRIQAEGLTLRDLANRFLTTKRHLLDTSELSERSFSDYHKTCEKVVKHFGRDRLVLDISIEDFEGLRAAMAKTLGPVALGNQVARVRILFRHASSHRLIPSPIEFGNIFKRPSQKTLRKARLAKGKRMFEAHQIRLLLRSTDVQMKAMVLLGINCAFGNTDISSLPITALDMKYGWVEFPRPKTAVPRRCPLWPETIAAVQEVLDNRKPAKNKADADLLFLTRLRQRWVRPLKDGSVSYDSISLEMRKVLQKLGIQRAGLGFYALRHGFQTVGEASGDQVATGAIMGHTARADDMASVYREWLADKRLRAVTGHVHAWLFESLTNPERELLHAAAKGLAVECDTAGVNRVSAGGKTFGGDDAEAAIYAEALADLLWRGLIEDVGGTLRRTVKGDAVLAKAEAAAEEE